MKEPKEVDWSKQKPGTIGVMRGGQMVEFLAYRGEASAFFREGVGFLNRDKLGRYAPPTISERDILLPWESQIAEGHNPDGLTNAQVGDGWKLISIGELVTIEAQYWERKWVPVCPIQTGTLTKAFATHRVPITKPKRRVPCGPEHFPPGTILRHNDFPNAWQMVIWVQSHSIGSMDSSGGFVKETYGQIMGFNGQRSTDFGKTWLPCYVETEE